MKTALIFANGTYDFPKAYLESIKRRKDAFFIAVDGGLNFLIKNDIKPNLLIGDLDSVDNNISLKGLTILKYPSKKDFTDTELALNYCLEYKYDDAILYGGLSSTRIDHSIANIFLLEKYTKKGLNLKIANPNNLIFCLIGPTTKELVLTPKTTISLLALSSEVKGLSLKGFIYPLEDHTLVRSSSLGISNKTIDMKSEITLKEGMLLVDIITKEV